MSRTIDLRQIVSSAEDPKGYAPYRPWKRTRVHLDRILELYEEMEAADALPMGSRQAGYRLKEFYPGQYKKEVKDEGAGLTTFESITEWIKRLSQARELNFDWVADASAVHYEPGGYDDPADYLHNLPEYERDLRQQQPVVVEIFTEAKETLPLIRRVAAERGVLVYSGSGSAGPKLARRAAVRAVERAARGGQATQLIAICDFDHSGVETILRPHIEHVSAFLYGTDRRNDAVITYDDPTAALPAVSFDHLLLTPEDALELAETEAERERVQAYFDSGTDPWTRDLKLLTGLRKIETEALDPRVLRDRVVEAIESLLDLEALAAVSERADAERAELESSLARLAANWDGSTP
jgi:hypothetical protein